MDLQLFLPVFLLSVGVFVLRKYLLVLWKRGTGELPPGPWAFPILGSALSIDPTKPYASFATFAEKYGKVFSVLMGGQLTVVIADVQMVKKAFKDERFAGRPRTIFSYFGLNLEDGLVFSDGERWKEQRRFALHALRDFGFGKSTGEEYMQKEATNLLNILRDSEAQPIDNHVLFAAATSNIVAYMMFSDGFSSQDPRFLQYVANQSGNFRDASGSSPVEVFPWLRFFPYFRTYFVTFRNRINATQKLLQELIDGHKATFDPEHPRDYIDAFLNVKETKSQASFTDAQLLLNIGDLFAASLETTSTFLRWSMLLMILHPEVQKAVQVEIDKVVGRSRPVAFADRLAMPFTEATLLELFRVSNFGPFLLPHRVTETVNFEGFVLPKDTSVIALEWYINRDPEVWEDPLQFKPERFLDTAGMIDQTVASNLLMFSIGKRVCPGEILARMEAFIFFTAILQNFTVFGEEGISPSLEPCNGLSKPC